MKFTANIFALSLLLSLPSATSCAAIQLKSPAVRVVNALIDLETVVTIKKYLADARIILMGKPEKGVRIGTYEYEGKKYSAQEIMVLEEKHGPSSEFDRLRMEMREDFERISAHFQESVQSVKPVMRELIIESSKERNRGDSLINKWANPAVVDDHALFDKHVHTVKDFVIFLIDLSNFLNDLLKSCPNGIKLYEKWRAETASK